MTTTTSSRRSMRPPCSPSEPWVCEPVDYTVGHIDFTRVEPYSAEHSAGFCDLRGGTTYRVDYTVEHNSGSNAILLAMVPTSGPSTAYGSASMGGRCADSTTAGVYTNAASRTFTPGDDRTFRLDIDAQFYFYCNSTGTVAHATVSYVSGPDPRYATLGPCANDSPPAVNQIVVPLPTVGDGSTTDYTTHYPIVPGTLTLYVNGLDWTEVVDDLDEAAGTYTLQYPVPLGATVTSEYRRAA